SGAAAANALPATASGRAPAVSAAAAVAIVRPVVRGRRCFPVMKTAPVRLNSRPLVEEPSPLFIGKKVLQVAVSPSKEMITLISATLFRTSGPRRHRQYDAVVRRGGRLVRGLPRAG